MEKRVILEDQLPSSEHSENCAGFVLLLVLLFFWGVDSLN